MNQYHVYGLACWATALIVWRVMNFCMKNISTDVLTDESKLDQSTKSIMAIGFIAFFLVIAGFMFMATGFKK